MLCMLGRLRRLSTFDLYVCRCAMLCKLRNVCLLCVDVVRARMLCMHVCYARMFCMCVCYVYVMRVYFACTYVMYECAVCNVGMISVLVVYVV